MHVGGEQPTEMAAKATEDDMAEGDLGNGLGKKPGGLYENSYSRGTGELLDLMPPVELLKRSSEPFSWRSCSTLYAEFRQELEAERPCPHWRYRGTSSLGDTSNEELRKRLQEVTEEAELLRCELEATRRHLDGKHEALKILQSQAVFEKATSHTKTLLQKSEERTKLLEKEVNTLQWEITFNQVQFKNFQQSWKEMYDSVCIENKALGDTVGETVKEMQELRSENSYLSQQCLELMALLSIREQRVIQGSQPLGSSLGEDGTVLELAVLGACHCHAPGGQPCPCARTAASSRKQVLHLKQEQEVQRRCKEEAYTMADAFRIAFEQQLKRKSDQVLRLAKTEGSLRKDQPRAQRGEASQKWRSVTVAQRLKGMLQSTVEGKISDDLAETLHRLVDLLNDKEEALAHQRKVSYMLARHTEELECRLQQLRAQDCAVTGSARTQDVPGMPDAQLAPGEDADAQLAPGEDADAQLAPGEDADAQLAPGEDADALAQSPGAGGSPAGTRATEGGSECS